MTKTHNSEFHEIDLQVRFFDIYKVNKVGDLSRG